MTLNEAPVAEPWTWRDTFGGASSLSAGPAEEFWRRQAARIDREEAEQRANAFGSLCPSCGLRLASAAMCPHHGMIYGEGWATGNRIFCDFFHRGIVPVRVDVAERAVDAELWV